MYIQTLFKYGKITEKEKKEVRPKASQVGKAQNLPKIHKS